MKKLSLSLATTIILVTASNAQVPPPGKVWWIDAMSGDDMKTFPACKPGMSGKLAFIGAPIGDSTINFYASYTCTGSPNAWGWVRN